MFSVSTEVLPINSCFVSKKVLAKNKLTLSVSNKVLPRNAPFVCDKQAHMQYSISRNRLILSMLARGCPGRNKLMLHSEQEG